MNDPIIEALKREQQRVALEFFKRPPKDHDLNYQYGFAMGSYAGLELAISRVLALYRDEKEDMFD